MLLATPKSLRLLTHAALLAIAGIASASQQASAPYLWYFDSGQPADIIMSSVKVPGNPTLATYYEVLGWNWNADGGGYTGIQWTPERVPTGGPVFIFSLWDPPAGSGAIVAQYSDRGTEVRRFGGEGTGLNSMNWTLGWVPDEWYNIVVRRWSCGAGHTCFGHWVQKEKSGIWTHNITMDYPVDGVMFSGGTAAFLEDFGSNGFVRSVFYRNFWKRMSNNSWVSGKQPYFAVSDSGSAIASAFDGRTVGDAFYLQAGEGTIASLSPGTYLPAVAMPASPPLTVGQIVSLSATSAPGRGLRVEWETNARLSPQFSYRIKVTSMTDGSTPYDQELILPHVRKVTLPLEGHFKVELSIKDIFDQRSNTMNAIAGVVTEFYNQGLGNYFITADPVEASAIDAGRSGPGWVRTGETFMAGGPNQVCRFYGNSHKNPATGAIYGPNSHFYTADATECESLKASFNSQEKSWKFESNDFTTTRAVNGTCPNTFVPIYRAYNNGFARGLDSNHRIASSPAAIQEVVTRGWISEGIVMCAPPAQPSSIVGSWEGTGSSAATLFGGAPYCNYKLDMDGVKLTATINDAEKITGASLSWVMTESIVGPPSCLGGTTFGTRTMNYNFKSGSTDQTKLSFDLTSDSNTVPGNVATFDGAVVDGRLKGLLTVRRTDQGGSLAWVLTSDVQ